MMSRGILLGNKLKITAKMVWVGGENEVRAFVAKVLNPKLGALYMNYFFVCCVVQFRAQANRVRYSLSTGVVCVCCTV